MAPTTKFPIEHVTERILFYLEHIDSQDLSAAVLDSTTTFDTRWKLVRIMLHFTALCTETVTITFISRNGSSYNTVLHTLDLSTLADGGLTDLLLVGESEDIYMKGDEIKVATTSGDSVTAYLTIQAKELS